MEKKYDVVIVGTGVAGCFAALHLPADCRILMITKEDLEDSDSFLAQGGICVLKNEEDFSSFMEDTLKAGHYENSRKAVEVMIRSSQAVIHELMEYGVRFQTKNGRLQFTREGAHSTNRILYHEDVTGKEITSVLLFHVRQLKNVTIAAKTTMLDLMCRNKACCGVVLEQNGEVKTVYAGDVILACGGVGGVFANSTNFPHLTGDGIAIAVRRGIRLKHVDYIQIHPTTLYSQEKGKRFLISESVRGEGAVLRGKDGERFVNELLPRDKVAAAIFEQMEKDHMPHVWIDMTEIKQHDIAERFPNIVKRCEEEGYDPKKEWVPVVPAQHYLMGGIETDTNAKTNFDHLYAAGETANNGVHGANRLASNSLLESLVFAGRAAGCITEDPGTVSYWRTDNEFLKQTFNIEMKEYMDLDRYSRHLQKTVLDEIEKEKNNGPDYNEVKCG